jgi:nitric-oxide synthase
MSQCPFHTRRAAETVAPSDETDARDFFRQAVAEGVADGTFEAWKAVRGTGADGSVRLSEEELVFGAKVAWRNQARCIGRLYWRSLLVRDFRDVADSIGMYTALCEHLELATRGGDIRPVMTVFAPAQAGRPGPLIRNRQLAGYAGYRDRGAVLGDPLNCALTEEALALGWQPPSARTAFDLLPWILVGRDERPTLLPVPTGLLKEVPLVHPTLEWWAGWGLKWYAVPVVCDMGMRLAGAVYPAAPFSGWYMGTEIGSRNLADEGRYNLLPQIARRMGLDTSAPASLWRERALVELNAAVLHSFAAAGCRIVDHHTASYEFERFCALEKKAGRAVSAQWDWIVPPLAGAATAVFHRPMTDLQLRPEFVHGGRAEDKTTGEN